MPDIDLSKYKLAFFYGNSLDTDRSADETMRLAQSGVEGDEVGGLFAYLVPKEADLTQIYGDDWDDSPAKHNAEWPYPHTLPEGSIAISGVLGGELSIKPVKP